MAGFDPADPDLGTPSEGRNSMPIKNAQGFFQRLADSGLNAWRLLDCGYDFARRRRRPLRVGAPVTQRSPGDRGHGPTPADDGYRRQPVHANDLGIGAGYLPEHDMEAMGCWRRSFRWFS